MLAFCGSKAGRLLHCGANVLTNLKDASAPYRRLPRRGKEKGGEKWEMICPFFGVLNLAVPGSGPFNLFIANGLTLRFPLIPWQGYCSLASLNCRSCCSGRSRQIEFWPACASM